MENAERNGDRRKKRKAMHSPSNIRNIICSTEEPLLLKGILSWDILNWSLSDWIKNLDNPQLDFRLGPRLCTKVPQWENKCEIISAPLNELLDENNRNSNDTWMYFDYKHIKHNFKNNTKLFESLSWADFGFPDKSGKDSTIWIGTKGAYTPCHMDSYGCNIVAQVHGRKLWVLFPPSKTSALKPTRVPYEESSIYSTIHFSCGNHITDDIREARVVELSPGDVLVVPNHWWHYVENLSTAVSINMWIPLESDHHSRLEEALVRFSIATIIKGLDVEGNTTLLNPNEMDLPDEAIDLRQITWCVEQVLARRAGEGEEVVTRREPSCDTGLSNISSVPVVSASELRRILLNKCGCASDPLTNKSDHPKARPLATGDIINAFCHPNVISQVAKVLLASRKK